MRRRRDPSLIPAFARLQSVPRCDPVGRSQPLCARAVIGAGTEARSRAGVGDWKRHAPPANGERSSRCAGEIFHLPQRSRVCSLCHDATPWGGEIRHAASERVFAVCAAMRRRRDPSLIPAFARLQSVPRCDPVGRSQALRARAVIGAVTVARCHAGVGDSARNVPPAKGGRCSCCAGEITR